MDILPEPFQERLTGEWERALGQLATGSPLRAFIQESWDRCRAARVDPDHSPLYRVPPRELEHRIRRSGELLALARSHLEWISATLVVVPHVLYLTDPDGIVLYSVGNDAVLLRESGLEPGYDWSEARMGTNGAGTALATGQPVAVVGPEHFVRAFEGCTCTAAPIRDARGTLLGALDLTTPNLPGVPGRLSLVAYAARMIVNELTAQRAAAERASEEWLRLAMGAGAFGAWEADLRAGTVRWDERTQAIFGRRAWEPIPLHDMLDFIHPDDRALAERTAAEALDAGGDGLYAVEKRIVRADGSVRWASVRGRVLFEGEGEGRGPVRILGTVTDITERKRADERLHFQAQLLNAVGQAVVATDRSGVITYWNRAAEALYGWKEEEVLGRNVIDVTPAELAREQAVELMSRLSAGESWSGEFMVRRKDGTAFPAMVTDTPVVDDEGGLGGVIGISWDLTERKRAEEALRAAKEEAEAANRAKTEFLSAMSHELRTPLNAIGGYLELIDLGVHGPVTDAQRKAFGRIKRNQEHLLTLINDILHFAKIEATKLEFRVLAVEVDDLLAGIEALVEPQAQAKGVSYSCDGPGPGVAAECDPDRVQQILLNLVGNAVKFTDSGGWVTVSAGADDEWAYLRVADSGRGIPPEHLATVFDPFVQLERHRNQASQQGVGLGLAISRELARAMGGELTAESQPGTGSTFTLRLRRATVPGGG